MSRDTIHRRDVLKIGGAAVLAGTTLAGCLGAPSGSEGNNSGGNNSGGDKSSVAIISSPAGFGDKAFNDLALKGLKNADEKFGVEIQKVEETNQSQYQSVQARLAESNTYDLIVLVGYNHTKALKTNAKKYPDQKWMLINAVVKEPNVAGYIWANHQMSFQAGVLAGTMTTQSFTYKDSSTTPDNTTVGFVGGVDSPLIRAFEKSYIKGVHHINKNATVRVGYAGTYSSPQQGKNIALSQYGSGADIIYHAAAATGKGVFQAAQERNRFAIGVDTKQSRLLPKYKDVIMGSAVKFINKGTFKVAKKVHNNNFEAVQGKNVLGLSENGVKLVLGQAIGTELPTAVKQNLESSRQAIINGEISVPCAASGCKA